MSQLPSGWQTCPLDQLVDILDGRRIPVNAKERASRPGSVPYYGATGQVGWIDEALFDEPLVLLGEDGVQFFDRDKPKAYGITGPAWVNNHAHVLRARDEVLDRRFLIHYLNWVDYSGLANGTTRLKLTQAAMRRISVRLPPRHEQQRIVDRLEDHLSRLDAGDETLIDGSKRLATLRRESIQRAVSLHAEAELPLGELIDRVEAGKSFGGSAPPAAGDEWGVIKVSAMTWGEFRPHENKAVPPELVNPAYEIAPGDVLVSRANTTAYVGAPVLVRRTPRRRLLSDKSLRLVPRGDVNKEWLEAVLSAPGTRKQISAVATGTSDSMRNISQRNLLVVRVPWVEPEDQASVVRGLNEVRIAIDRLEYELARARKRSGLLRRGLLEAAFSGRLTGRSADAEVVEELAGVGA